MSVKHVNEYYKKVSQDYLELLDELSELEDDVANNVTPPEALENLKTEIEPLKTNYMTLSYVIYLLNQPNKKSQIKRYASQMKFEKNKSNYKTEEEVLEENKEILDKISKNKLNFSDKNG